MLEKSGDRRSASAGDDVDDDGSTNQRRDGIKGNNTTLAREETDEVADEGYDCSTEDGGRQQHPMIVCRQQQSPLPSVVLWPSSDWLYPISPDCC